MPRKRDSGLFYRGFLILVPRGSGSLVHVVGDSKSSITWAEN